MNKRKIVALALSLSMVAILAVGGTLAYFTAEDADTNVFTVGNIKIDQIEEFEQNSELIPGEDPIDKIVTVKNTGTGDAWVRTLFAFEDTRDLNTAMHYNSDVYSDFIWPAGNNDWLQIQDENGTVWTVGYYVQPELLAAGETTDPILEAVWVDNTANNTWAEIAGEEYEILVLSQGCQQIEGKTGAEALDAAFGAITYDADALVAEWFSEATGKTLTAFDYSSYTEPMWYDVAE